MAMLSRLLEHHQRRVVAPHGGQHCPQLLAGAGGIRRAPQPVQTAHHLPVVTLGRRRRVLRLRAVSRLLQVQERFVRGIATRVVVCEHLDGRPGEAPFERLGGAPVQHHASRRTEVGLHHPADDVVRELVALGPASSSRRAPQAPSNAASTSSSSCSATAVSSAGATARPTTPATPSTSCAAAESPATRWRSPCATSHGTLSAPLFAPSAVRSACAQLTRKKGTPPARCSTRCRSSGSAPAGSANSPASSCPASSGVSGPRVWCTARP